MLGLKKFYVRMFAKNEELRGISILYDQAMEGTMDPIVVAMSSAFVPFATYAVASAGQVARPKVEYGTGLIASASGHVVAARRLVDGCHVITIPRLGSAERLAEDKDGELALLRVYGARGLVPVGLSAAAAGKELKLLGIADPQSQAGETAITAVAAKLGAAGNAHALDAAPAPGFSGAAALNGQGHVVGIAVHKPAVVAGAAGAPPAVVVPAEAVRRFLKAHDVTPAAVRPGDGDATLSVVRVICVRK
jgi:S1-C subfamily serine protease